MRVKSDLRSMWFALMAVVMFSACKQDVVVAEYKSYQGQWPADQPALFNLPELDSAQSYNLFINLRNTNDYPFNNIYLITTMEFPHGKTLVDTLEYRMAYPDGRWMGQGMGTVKDNKLWYREQVRFVEEGSYTLRIEHAVRNNGEVDGVKNLQGITEVGYSIERATP